MRVAILGLAVLTACTPAIYEVPGVVERNATEVAGCTDLGRVHGIPGVFGALKDIGLKDARRAAKERAKEVGGNTVVFDPVPDAEVITDLPAQVYSC
ncbi:MAG: hypothetical protein ABJN34_04395 [Litoreibacter sp.]|uniref:hypothetical protein n=1 Tax=Litoreibacter sp. TaxID=1969459 RepID=UPI0032989373